jgi:hypothetical protein
MPTAEVGTRRPSRTKADSSGALRRGNKRGVERWTTLISVTDPGKLLVGLGALVMVAGLVLMLLGRTNLPVGRLPGDILYRGKNTTFYFPLATSILLSVLLSLVLYLVGRFRR